MAYQTGPKITAQRALPRRSMFAPASEPVIKRLPPANEPAVKKVLRTKIDAVPAVSPKAEAKRIAKRIAKGGEKGELVGVRLSPELLARIDAVRGHATRQGLIKDAIEAFLDRAKPL